jgi:hypothetical protein
MLLARPLVVDGRFWGTTYTLEKVGDVFPVHTHDKNTNHITILAFGGIRCQGHPRYEGVEIYAQPGGTIIDWVPGEPHGWTALTDGATWVNIRKVRSWT